MSLKTLLRTLLGLGLGLGLSGLLWAQTVTLNLKDADINALISTVAEVTGKNFIIDPRVKGKVTVVSSQPMDSKAVYAVFLSILQVHGFAAVPSGAVIKIVPDVNAKQDSIPTVGEARTVVGDEMVTRVVQVDNVSAAQLVPILRPLVPQQGHLAAYPSTNVLIISDRADNVDRLVQIIRRIDTVSDSEIEVIPLEHASAVEVVRVLTVLNRASAAPGAAGAAEQPTLVADERTNSILLGGDRADRLRLRAIISHLDTPLDRGGNTHVIYLRYAKAEDMVKVLTGVSSGIDAEQKGKAATAAAGAVNIQADDSANAVVITAPPDVFRSLQAVIRQLDIRRAQVHVDAVIAEITEGKDAALGIQWRGTNDLTGNGVIGGTSLPSTNVPSIGSVAANPLSAGDGLSLGYFEGTASIFGTEFLNIGVLLQALSKDTSTNILATPTLVTLDNEEAEIVVAQNVPFVTGSFSSTGANQGAANPFQTIQRQDVGLTLRVTPQINEGNAIQLTIEQESSSVNEKGVQGASDIVTNKRSIKTSVLVEDRQMVVLGGLINDSLTENVKKVPLLGDIPILGHLFKSRDTTKSKTNLMVFIQPSILRDAAVFTNTSSGKYNYMRTLQTEAREAGVNLLPKEAAPLLPEYPQPLPGGETGTAGPEDSGESQAK